MRRAWRTWLSLAAFGVTACGNDAGDRGHGRFTPGESDIASSGGPTDDCEAGVCSPSPSKSPGAVGDASAGGGAGACQTNGSCASAAQLGELRGDIGSDVLTREGVGSAFFRVDVKEEAPWYGEASPMKVVVSLVSPTSTQYDLYVHEGCTQSVEEGPGDSDQVRMTWGESRWVANLVDDSKTLLIEVRQVSPTCDDTNKWSLLVQGNVE